MGRELYSTTLAKRFQKEEEEKKEVDQEWGSGWGPGLPTGEWRTTNSGWGETWHEGNQDESGWGIGPADEEFYNEDDIIGRRDNDETRQYLMQWEDDEVQVNIGQRNQLEFILGQRMTQSVETQNEIVPTDDTDIPFGVIFMALLFANALKEFRKNNNPNVETTRMSTSTSSPMLPIIEGIIRDIAFQPFIEPTSPDSGSSQTLVNSHYEGEQTDTGEYQSNLSLADMARLQQWDNGNSDDDIVYPRYSRYTEDLRQNNYANFMAQTVNQRINLLSDQPAIPIRLRTFEEETLPPVNGITVEDFNETFEDWAQLHHLLSGTNISPTLAHALISSRTHFLAYKQLDKLIKEAVKTICKMEQRSEESLRLAKHFFDLATDRGLNKVEVIRGILLERNTQQNAQTTVIDEGEGRIKTETFLLPQETNPLLLDTGDEEIEIAIATEVKTNNPLKQVFTLHLLHLNSMESPEQEED
ncbi:hypothetical protein CPB83DRAFT_895081 [Crepidotus variabilis]|uniref:Uncharacterized protein n=1 Tax=Crepidotus variabilis TaxID=179855 RepID=A0A9P6EEW0_9AGAR|nr:hypothetical protein CPB83DRAFT_895081 [Crepidotus variabilis]